MAMEQGIETAIQSQSQGSDREKSIRSYLDSNPHFVHQWLQDKVASLHGNTDQDNHVSLQNLLATLAHNLPDLSRRHASSPSALPPDRDRESGRRKGGPNDPGGVTRNGTTNKNQESSPSPSPSPGPRDPEKTTLQELEELDESGSISNSNLNGRGGEKEKGGADCGIGSPPESSSPQPPTPHHPHIRSKRNSISSDRFHTWLSSTVSTSSLHGGSSSSNNNNNNTGSSGGLAGSGPRGSTAGMDGGAGHGAGKEGVDGGDGSDPNELFIELVKDISNELNIDCLCHKILVNVSYLTQADRCSLFLARGPIDQRYLVAKLFDVTMDSVAEEAMERALAEDRRIPFGVGIVGYVAQTKEMVNLKDAYQDARFNAEVDCRTGYRTVSILALPICNNEGTVIGVAQVINKKTGDFSFTSQDVEVFQRYLTFCGIGIQNAQLFETSVAEYRKNQLLLNLARSIFEEQTGVERLVGKIMKEAQELLKCERSLVYLRDVPLYEASQIEKILMMPSLCSSPAGSRGVERKMLTRRESKTVNVRQVLEEKGLAFDLIFELNMEEDGVKRLTPLQLQNSPLSRIAQYVASNSEILNIGDAVSWYGECGKYGEEPPGGGGGVGGELVVVGRGGLPKSILSMPIYNGQRQVIGVAQLINKAGNTPFTDSDAMTFEAFAIFCGLGIHNTQLYESACKLMAKQSVALECLSYHATATPEDTERLRRDDIPSSAHFLLTTYAFSDFRLTDSETCQATVRMFLELHLVNTFHIPYHVLCRWILSVKKNYRPVKYHNWRHAFNVAQTMFTVLKTGKMEQFLDDLDILGLMVACLCHDLDHRGTNNAFQQLTASPLAVLYSTSTMEHHHFDQCVMILSSEGNNIFQDLSSEYYRKVMKIVEKSILSTDLAMYFRKKDQFIKLIDEGEISWQGEDKKELLCGMMMTACDVAAISKPWEIQHKIAKLVADEFFDQGDLEKEQLNQQPVAMMDREKKDELPKMQLSFIDVICLPLYKTLSEIFPWLQPLYEGCKGNRKNWQDLAEKVDMGLTWIDHDFIEKPVEDFMGADPELEDVNLVVTTLNCSTHMEGASSGGGSMGALGGRVGGKMGRRTLAKWFRTARKKNSWGESKESTSSKQSPERGGELGGGVCVGGSETNLVILEENENQMKKHKLKGGGGGKFSPKKTCSIS